MDTLRFMAHLPLDRVGAPAASVGAVSAAGPSLRMQCSADESTAPDCQPRLRSSAIWPVVSRLLRSSHASCAIPGSVRPPPKTRYALRLRKERSGSRFLQGSQISYTIPDPLGDRTNGLHFKGWVDWSLPG